MGATDQWSALWHIMNMSTESHTVYIEYEIDYVTGADLAAMRPLTSYFYDVDDCWGDSAYNVPGGGGPGSVHTKAITYTAPRNGTRVYTGWPPPRRGYRPHPGAERRGGVSAHGDVHGRHARRHHLLRHSCERGGRDDDTTDVEASNEFPLTAVMGISLSYVWEP